MAKKLLGMVIEREKLRKESLDAERAAFEKECLIRNYQRSLDIQEEDELLISTASKKKRKILTESGSE